MSDKISAQNFLNDLMETFADKRESVSFFEGENSNSVKSRFKRLFGRQKPVHHLLGGGKSADILLWRDKKISASVLTSATSLWVLFEWLNYHLLTLLCLALVLVMLVQFFRSNVSGFSKSVPSEVPHLVLPADFLVNTANTAVAEINRGLRFLQDVACRGNLKQFLVVVGSLLAAAVLGGSCNFLTVIYIGFVAAHTLPVLYERHEDEVDNFVYKVLDEMQNRFQRLDVYKVLDEMQNRFQRLDVGFLSRFPRGELKGKKHD